MGNSIHLLLLVRCLFQRLASAGARSRTGLGLWSWLLFTRSRGWATASRPLMAVMPHESLVEVLQYRFDLRGARESCGQGLCGRCTV